MYKLVRKLAVVSCCTLFFVVFIKDSNSVVSRFLPKHASALLSQVDVGLTPHFGKTHFIVGQTEKQRKKQVKQKAQTKSSKFNKHSARHSTEHDSKQYGIGGQALDGGAHEEHDFDVYTINSIVPESGAYNSVYFSPDDDMRSRLLHFIGQEQERICAAVFIFTDKDIAHALINAQKRGVPIEIITDATCIRDKHNKIGLLCDADVPVFVYGPQQTSSGYSGIMHHKFIVFSKNMNNRALLWTGSFNFTKSACDSNQENVIVLSEAAVIERFYKQFARLKERSYRYSKV